MSAKQEYIARADGWIAGIWCARGSTVSLSEAQAKYENVSKKKNEGSKVELTGSIDDPTVKSTGLASKAKAETANRGKPKPSSSTAVGHNPPSSSAAVGHKQ